MITSSWVVLTRGDRPDDLGRAIGSIRTADPDGEIILVGNGWAPGAETGVDRIVMSEENLGVPGGRNLGWRNASGDVVFFLDDDAWVGSPTVAAVLEAFASDIDLGIVSFRIEDPETGLTAHRHIPRIGGSGADRASAVSSFLGGASAIRRAVLVDLDGFWADLFYSHEETDFSFRAIDSDYAITYLPEVTIYHTAADPGSRHTDAVFYSMRNRVLVARRDLPRPLGLIHVATWVIIGLARARSRRDLRAIGRGLRAGLAMKGLDRDPIGWSTVWRLTRLGRPPII